jgi:mannose-6-phosphate isomerase
MFGCHKIATYLLVNLGGTRMALYLPHNPVMDYAWGTKDFIPNLLGVKPTGRPQAELWMGAHPKAPSIVLAERIEIPLDKFVEQNREEALGPDASYDTLPFLLKILSAAQPLSIQAYPNKEQAERGFDRENKRSTPLDSPLRSYKDSNHKPELVCALTHFNAMVGFRSTANVIQELSRYCPKTLCHELELLEENEDMSAFFESIMTLGEKNRRMVLDEAAANASRIEGTISHWIMRLREIYPNDIGVLAPAYLNLIELKPGQAIFLEAGLLHAYLDGTIIELMASSDNMVRGGLTGKHVDVPEFLNIVNFSETELSLVASEQLSSTEYIYRTSAKEFALSVIHLTTNRVFRSPEKRSVEILLCAHGSATLEKVDQEIEVRRGTVLLIPASDPSYTLSGQAVLYKATVPLHL